jgi:DNA-binding MarR family transcriptional regulator/DNA-binding CsgD family transcriptional regulator
VRPGGLRRSLDREEAATLESTGLAPAEALTYRTLLRFPSVSVGDLAGRLSMSIGEVRAALRSLESKGLVGRLPGASHRFAAAVSPDEALRPLVRRHRADLRAMRADIDLLVEEYRDGRTGRGGERVEVLDGDAIEHAKRLVARARTEVCALVTDATRALPKKGRAVLRTGIPERTVYPRSALARPDERCEIESAVRAGAQLRVVDRPPFAMLIVDRSLALVATTSTSGSRAVPGDGGPSCGAVVVHPGGLHDSLLAVFDRTWSIAAPLRITASGLTCGDPAVTVPCPDDLRLLTLLLDGLTDETIATKLDIGTRTVQRRVRDLIEAAGVRTRLQLIWQATRRGWI